MMPSVMEAGKVKGGVQEDGEIENGGKEAPRNKIKLSLSLHAFLQKIKNPLRFGKKSP